MVKLRKVDDKTTGGLFVPTTEIEKPKEGTIVLAGPGKANPETGALIDCPVKDGDLVMLSDYSGEKVDYNNEQHIFTDADTLLEELATLAARRQEDRGVQVTSWSARWRTELSVALAVHVGRCLRDALTSSSPLRYPSTSRAGCTSTVCSWGSTSTTASTT